MEKLNNPHAFPFQSVTPYGEPNSPEFGMTLLDWFAGQALAGLLANPQSDIAEDWSWRTGSLTGDAYVYADDMLAARKTLLMHRHTPGNPSAAPEDFMNGGGK
jgi:hypothetical protein